MKKTTLLTLILLALAVTACNNTNDKKEIRANAIGYMQAVGDYNFDAALPYSSRHTREETIPVFKYLLEHADTAYINSNRPCTFTINKLKKLNDTTACVYYHKSSPIKEVDDSLTLIYEEGHWLADVHLAPIPLVDIKRNGPMEVPQELLKVKPVPLSEVTRSSMRAKNDSISRQLQ